MALLRIYRGVTERTQIRDVEGHVTPGKSERGKRERVRGEGEREQERESDRLRKRKRK